MDNALIKIACIGDSITYGYGIKKREFNSYPKRLEIMLGDHYVNYPEDFLAYCGACVWHRGLKPFASTFDFLNALDWAADIQIVCLGSNDTLYPITDEFRKEFIEDYEMLLGQLKENSYHAQFYLCLIPPMFGDSNITYARVIPIINELITDVANKTGATLIDLNTPLSSREDLFSDGVHPNEAGAKMIAEIVYNAIITK